MIESGHLGNDVPSAPAANHETAVLCILVDHNTPHDIVALSTRLLQMAGPIKLRVKVINNGRPYRGTVSLPDEFEVVECENEGFAAAVNLGLQGLKEPFVWLLNPDARPQLDALAALLDTQMKTGAGIVGSCITHGDGSFQTAGSGTSKWLLYRSMPFSELEDDMPLLSACGASMLMTREVIQKIGYLDDRFFLYCEETDYCLRAHQAGFSVRLSLGSTVSHVGSVSVGQDSPMKKLYQLRNIVLLHRKHSTWWIFVANVSLHLLRAMLMPKFSGMRLECIKMVLAGASGRGGRIA